MKFKGLTSMALAGIAAMSMSVSAFAASVPEKAVDQTQETVCVTMAESAADQYVTRNEGSANSKIDILGDENGGPVTRGASAPETLWQWSDGDYEGTCLPLYQGRGVYTNYKFKPTNRKLTVSLELYADQDWTDNRKLTIRLYKKSGNTWSYNTLKTFRFTPDPNDVNKIFEFSHTFTALDNDAEYCIRLYNDSVLHSGYGVADYAIGADTILVSAN